MNTYKLIALDMDGTLLRDDKTISEENREAIAAAVEAGKTVIMSTGRGYQSIMPFLTQLGLATPIVAVNGGEVWEAPGILLQRQLLASDMVRKLHAFAEEQDVWWWAYAVEGIFNRKSDSMDIEGPNWLKFGCYTEDLDKLLRIREYAESLGALEITNSDPYNIELNPLGVNKAKGVEAVCDLLNISMSEVIAMGDSENDASMIRAAGLGVAMGNAQEEVKKIADLTTVSNEEHAVAKIIREYMLQQ